MVVSRRAAPDRAPTDWVKTDKRDAVRLARRLAAAELTLVRVPSVEHERLRDLVRCQEDIRGDLMRARHRLSKFLLRREIYYQGPAAAWTQKHRVGTRCARATNLSALGLARMSPPDFEGEPITPQGLAAVKAERFELETQGRREIARRILAARELGDLKENAEYHAAKEDQAHMETRIQRRQRRLRSAVVVDESGQGDVVTFGHTAEVLDEGTGITHNWNIVGSTEADLSAGLLSAESPVAKVLLGRSAGESVEVSTPKGLRLRIKRVL
jgi:transcription elongation factor GreA